MYAHVLILWRKLNLKEHLLYICYHANSVCPKTDEDRCKVGLKRRTRKDTDIKRYTVKYILLSLCQHGKQYGAVSIGHLHLHCLGQLFELVTAYSSSCNIVGFTASAMPIDSSSQNRLRHAVTSLFSTVVCMDGACFE